MSLRQEVMSCVRERVLNLGAQGTIFKSTEDHLNWLLGVGSENKGFMQDPKGALELSLRSEESVFHHGIQINADEETELRACVEEIVLRNVPAMAGGPQMGNGLAFCTPTVDPGCWY